MLKGTSGNQPNLFPGAAQITAGSGTGITVNNTGEVRDTIFKVTASFTAFQAAATTADITLGTLPAKSQLLGIVADVTQAFAGTAGTIALTVGKSAGAAEYLASADVKTAAVTKGLADADLGTAMTRAAAIQGGAFSWAGTQIVSARITSGSGNLTGLNAGSVTFYLTVRTFP
jgi:hypothetical protein